MASMTVAKRLGLGFGAVITLMIVIAVLAITSMRSADMGIETIVQKEFPKTVWANNMIDGINNIARSMRNALLETAPEKIRLEMERIEKERSIIKENLEKLKESIKSEKGLAALKVVEDARGAYVGSQDEFIKLMNSGRQEEAKVLLLSRIRAEQRVYLDSVVKLIDLQTERLNEIGDETEASVNRAIMMIIVLSIIALIAAIVIGMMIVRNLMKQLGGEPDYAAEAVHKIAGGDLTHNLDIKPGDTSSLLYSLKTMQDSLRAIVAEIKNIVEAAAIRGDFSVKMDLTGKAGYTKELSDLLNSLSNVSETGLNDVTRVATALANGDLSQKITGDYAGVFDRTKNGVNGTVDALTKIVGEIKAIVEDAAVRGSFATKMDLNGKAGYTKELSDLLNQLSDV
ncbi:MAG: MCP four helix bundle domain-containing protein, partial [Gallionella sp.]|nr:MCP four helix bundle domain-containing protein [Gallionella sp.]